jgi:hypothetical protein
VDTIVFKARSTRSAAASIASNSGIPVATILKRIGWSKESTFAKFYKKNIVEEDKNIGQSLLRNCVK